ncbi:MAG TPA: M1 family metallopeptidase [Kofleriaceae bacterium]|jgi:alanyl aminopeptidase
MPRPRLLALALSVALASCGSPTATPPPTTPVAATTPQGAPPTTKPPSPPELRLPKVATPTHEQVELTIDPSTEDFSGRITTQLTIDQPLRTLWLNATEITVDDATITIGDQHVKATALPPVKNYLGLTFDRELPVGPATLTIAYRGKDHREDGDGIYTAKSGDDWYAFTQFESTDARQAFPCFDEPSYKIPWQLTIHTKAPLMVVSNTPVEKETPEANGMKAVRFVETLPLPSYLVAFAIGPFETVDAGKTRSGAPIRIVVPKGHTADVAYPAKTTKRILDGLEDYFGSPYPYPKLDALAVSVFNAGAMENPGLITYRESIIMTKPEEMTHAKQELYATVAAHEMAHQWFGDKVTMAWWDDTWLNESFASWMESKLIRQLEPTWDEDIAEVQAKSGVMGNDSLDTARVIRQPIVTASDIVNAFDGITYEKGEAVLTMIERWMTPDVFQKGVRAYIAKHAFKNATYDDFVAAMTEAAGKDEKPLFDSFVLQSGVPFVSVKLDCTTPSAPKLELAQRRYKPTGSKIDPNRTWNVPVCVKWGAGKTIGRDCTMLSQATGELPLSAKSCPAWVLPNEGELGYYRFLPQGDLLAHLDANTKSLTLAERVGLVSDVEALVTSGDVQTSVALQLVSQLSKDNNRHIVDASIGIVAGLDELVSDKLRPNYERFIRKLYQARARELGWASKPGEDENTKELRPSLLALVAGRGEDPQLIKQAIVLANKWLDDHKAVQPELVNTVLTIAARHGDQALFDRLHAAAKATTDRVERGRLLAAMGSFYDSKIEAQALAIMLTNEFELREGLTLMSGGFSDPRTRQATFELVKQHFDELMTRMPPAFRPFMAQLASIPCDSSKKADVQAFFTPKFANVDGGPRALAQALEELDLCWAQKQAQLPGVEAFLKAQ